MAGTKISYVIEEIDGRYIGIGIADGELFCNTIPLSSRDEAEANLKASCYSAWGDSIDIVPEFHIPWVYELAVYISKLYAGEGVNLPNLRLACHPSGKFWRAIMLMGAIPRGRVTTYGELARAIGTSPRAAGNYASRNPFPLIIPCHRVVRSDTSIGGYSYGPIVKASLLMAEGVRVDLGTGKIDPTKVIRSEELLRLEVRRVVDHH